MEITKEMLEKKLQELGAQRDQFIANANVISGAIQQCQELIVMLEKPAKEG